MRIQKNSQYLKRRFGRRICPFNKDLELPLEFRGPKDSMTYTSSFEEQYELIAAAVDEIAERVRVLGGKNRATLKEFINSSQIEEDVGSFPDVDSMLGNLLSDHETIVKTLRKNIKKCQDLDDEGTANFLKDKMEQHEKIAWMLRSFIV